MVGWPTANLQVDGRKCLPKEGVYAAWAWRGESQQAMPIKPELSWLLLSCRDRRG